MMKWFCVLLLALLATPVLAFEKGTLEIWINNDKGYKGLAEVGQQFEADTGIPVIVKTPESLTTKFDRVGYTTKAPDIVIWPHDRFGSWINRGILEQIEPSPGIVNAMAPFAWEAVSVGNKIYGYPIATEVVSLIYNRDLIDKPPATLGDVVRLDKRLRKQNKRAIAWDYKNLYFSWPILAGAGAYSFGKRNGFYNLADPGVSTKGAMRGVRAIRDLLEQGVLDRESDYGSMMSGFKDGKVATIINGPWAWDELRDAGINIGIADVPGVDADHPGKPFVGVLAAGISSVTPNKKIARQFLEDYLLTVAGLSKVNDDKPLGAVTHLKMMESLGDDPFIDHTFESASHGEVMPNVPEMKRFWEMMTRRFEHMLADEAPVAATLEKANARLERLDEIRGFTRRGYFVE